MAQSSAEECPKLLGVQSAMLPFRVPQPVAQDFAIRTFGTSIEVTPRLAAVFDHAGVEEREFVVSPEWFEVPKDFETRNELYVESCVRYGTEAAEMLLEKQGVSREEIDGILFVSTTGLATPSIEARLIKSVGLRSSVTRIPIWGWGCVGGTQGLSLAARILEARPRDRLLLIHAELCGLTFQFGDHSVENFVATALFSDAVTASLVVGAEVEGAGWALTASETTTWPDSLGLMGWSVHNEGFQVIFSKQIPQVTRDCWPGHLDALLSRRGLRRGDIAAWWLHPGGRKVLEAYESILGAQDDPLAASREVLQRFGNCSSCTVMKVIEAESGRADLDGPVVASALGPGFTAGSLILQPVR